VPLIEREKAVALFQAGKLRVIFAHPQSAGHGLTLTKGTATIWVSPTYNAEHFQQFNRRIYRAGQTQRTETICIAAAGTAEEQVYEKLNGKIERMDTLMDLLCGLQDRAA
jgi:SNF2 family DNA or RNA helicase